MSDVVRANMLAADSDVTGAINIGHGRETSVLDLIEALRDIGGDGAFEPEFAPERLGEVRRSCLDVTRAKRELGWEAGGRARDGLRAILAERDPHGRAPTLPTGSRPPGAPRCEYASAEDEHAEDDRDGDDHRSEGAPPRVYRRRDRTAGR